MQNLVPDIIASLETYADPIRGDFTAKMCPTESRVIGVTSPQLKQILKELKVLTKDYSPGVKIQLAKELVQTKILECGQLGYEFIGKDKQCILHLTSTDLDELGIYLDNWVSVDTFAVFIVGNAWREKIINIHCIKDYLKSENFWIRRVGVVATVSLNQKARGADGDPEQTLEICKLVVDDHADMINKALSWALRELSKRDKQSVIEFMAQYNKRLHKRVIREVTNKLEKGTKN